MVKKNDEEVQENGAKGPSNEKLKALHEPMADSAAFPGTGAGRLPFPERPDLPDAGFPPPAEQVVGNVAAGGDDFAGRVRGTGVFAGVKPVAVKVIAGVAPPSFGVLRKRASVGGKDQMAVFVTGEISLYDRPVRLPEIQQPFPGGRGQHGRRQTEEDIEYQRQVSQTGRFRFHTITNDGIFSRIRKPICKKPASLK